MVWDGFKWIPSNTTEVLIGGDLTFNDSGGSTHFIQVQDAPATVSGDGIEVLAGKGGPASGGTPGGDGGSQVNFAGIGGAAGAGVGAAGQGGSSSYNGGPGGAGSATGVAGPGGSILLIGGSAGSDGGAGGAAGGNSRIDGGVGSNGVNGEVRVGTATASVVKLGRSGISVTVQTGSTLDTTGTGMIDLPALFKIATVAVSANVTASNLNELTGGGVTALHSHAGGGGVTNGSIYASVHGYDNP